MPVLVVDGCRLSYEEHGAGPVALLVHGSPGNAKAWARVGERLADRYRVIAPDLPGYGETSPQPAGETPDVGYASRLIEGLVRHVGPPAVLAGHSYGGVVALGVALQGEVPVGALALFEPVAMKVLAMAGELAAYGIAKTFFDGYIASFEGGDERAVQRMIDFWFGPGAFEKMPERLTAYLLRETASNIRDVRASFRESYSADAFRRLTMPVVTVVGDRSPEITHDIARVIAAYSPSGSLATLANADHALTATHAQAVAQIIADASNGVSLAVRSSPLNGPENNEP
jgi:pimeloyl-ACP methyl ester carboxylesterase